MKTRFQSNSKRIGNKLMLKVDKHMDPQVEDDLKQIYGSPLPDVFSSPLPKYLGEDY